jgi:hypothetical protein
MPNEHNLAPVCPALSQFLVHHAARQHLLDWNCWGHVRTTTVGNLYESRRIFEKIIVDHISQLWGKTPKPEHVSDGLFQVLCSATEAVV